MHPTMMKALANEIARERQNRRERFNLQSQGVADRSQLSKSTRGASWIGRRRLGRISLRARLA
jgi:hypothetical protein